MFFRNIIRFLLVLFTIFLCDAGYAQQKLSEGEQEVKNNAYQLLEDENYAEALPQFSRLLSLYPKDPEYNFAYGVCLIEENKDLDKALQFLNYTIKNMDKPAALYYTGRVWHIKFKFDEALKYYNQFKEKAKKDDLKKYPVDRQIKMCNSGKELIRYVSILNIEENKVVKSKDFYYSYNIDDFGGKILVKPEEFKTKLDKKKERRGENKSLMFLSTELNVVYYSSYGENDKAGKDIYRRVKDNATGEWLPPENLGIVINTPFDEDYPYIHPDRQTLYFASKGHNSMGGYDIFKSAYDWATNTWSKPENLDFPTNSPFDDILYISDAKENIAYFASNRETGHDNISVYRIKIEKKPKKKETENFEEIIRKSKLEIFIPAIVMTNREDGLKTSIDYKTSSDASTTTSIEKGKYTFTELSLSDNLTANDVYKEADNDAQTLQGESDAAMRDANVVLIASNAKNLAADEKRKEAGKEKDKNTAEQKNQEADKLSREAVVAYNLAMNLKAIAEDKKRDAKETQDFLKEISFNKNKPVKELVVEVNSNRKKINDRQKNYTTVEKEKELMKSRLVANDFNQKLSAKTGDLDNVKNSLADLDNKIKANKDKLEKEINTAVKNKLEQQNKNTEIEISNKKKQEYQLDFEIRQLNTNLKNTNDEIAFYQALVDDIKSNKVQLAETEKTVAKIDNNKLSKDISEKKAVVEKQLSVQNLTTDNKVETKSNEQVVTENKKIEKDKNLLVANENYNKLITEAKTSERVSDSLTVVINDKKKNLDEIKDKKKREEEQDKINNMQTIADFKKQDADKKYTQANEIGKTYIALNEVNANKTTDTKTENTDTKTADTKADNKTDNKSTDTKTETENKSETSNAVTGNVVMKSVLTEKEKKTLQQDNPAYNKVINEGTKALRMYDSLMVIVEGKKKNQEKIKNPQEKQAELEKISNMENIAAYKRDYAEKRFKDVNQYEKAYLTSVDKTSDLLANTNTEENKSEKTTTDTKNTVTNENKTTDKSNEIKNTSNTNSNDQANENTNKKNLDKKEIEEFKNSSYKSLLDKNDQKQLSSKNTAYSNNFTDAARSQTVADSLFQLADKKKKALTKIKDNKKKQSEEEVINNMENIAVFKKQYSKKKYAQVNETEQEYLASKNLNADKTEKTLANTTTDNKTNDTITSANKDNKTNNLTAENTKIEQDKAVLMKNETYSTLIAQAKKSETQADSLKSIAEKKRKELPGLSKKEKKKAEEVIAMLDNSVIQNQKEADLKYSQANETGQKLLAENKTTNALADNKTENNSTTTNKTVLTDTDKSKLTNNEKYNKLVSESEKNQHTADSLTQVAETKKKNLNKIKDAQEKQAEQDKITNIESIAKFKKEYAEKKNNEAAEYGKTFLAENPNLVAENNTKKNEDKNKTNKTQDGVTDLTSNGEVNKDDIKKLKDAIYDKMNDKNKTNPTYNSSLTENEKSKLAGNEKFNKIVKDANKAQHTSDSLNQVADAKKKNLTKIKDVQEKQAEQDKITNIESIAKFKQEYADKKYTEADDYGKNYLVTNNLADNTTNNQVDNKKENKTETKSNTSDATTNQQNKIIEENKQTLVKDNQYNQLITEAQKSETQADSLSYLAKEKRSKLNTISNTDERKTEENKITEIEHEVDTKRQYSEQTYVKANNYGKDVLAANNSNADTKSPDIFKATPEEQDKYFKENTTAYQKIENDVVTVFTDANDKLLKINNTANNSEKEQLQKELMSILEKAIQKMIDAYKVKYNADIVRNTMLSNKVVQMLGLPDVQNNKQIAERYKKDADSFRDMAEKAVNKAMNTSSTEEKLKELRKALDYAQLAIKSNETAIDILIDTKPVEFVSASNLIKTNDNDAFAQLQKIVEYTKPAATTDNKVAETYDKKAVKNEVIAKLYVDKNNKVVIDKAGDYKEAADKEMQDVKKMEETLAGYKESASIIDNPDDKKKYEEKANDLTKKLYKKKYGIAQNVQKEHELMYDLYIKNVMTVRPSDDSPAVTEGVKIEAQASEDFNKAKELREKAANEKDQGKAISMLDQADTYEQSSLEKQEKAYGVYLNMISVASKKEETKVIAQNTDITNNKENKTENTVKNETKTEVKDTKKVTDNTKDIKVDTKKETKTEIKTETKENKKEVKNTEVKNTEVKNKTGKKKNEINVENIKAENRLATVDGSDAKFGFKLTPKNKAVAESSVPVNEAIPAGIVYKVQVGAFKVPISATVFKGLSPLACERLANSHFVKYLVGLFKTEEAAKIAREEVRRVGYKDAFIVTYKDGVRIPLYMARSALKGENYNEMAKNEVETLNKNIKDAKTTVSDNATTENKNQAAANDATNEKKKKGKKTIEDYKKEKEANAKKNDTKAENKANQGTVKAVNIKDVKGIMFTVQIGVFRNPRTSKDLYNLSPVFEEKITLGGQEAIKYMNGIFSDYMEAITAKDKIVRLGIKDAFVVVYHNGKAIPVNQATLILKNQGASALANPNDLNISITSNADNVKAEKDKKKDAAKPKNIVFKIQVGAFKGQAPDDKVDQFIKVSTYGALSDFMEGEMKIYTIGEYKTYDEALKIRKKIFDDGVKDAFIIAFMGSEKITIEKALELLNQ